MVVPGGGGSVSSCSVSDWGPDLKLVPGHRYEAYTGMTAVCQGWLSEEALASLVFTPLCMRPLCAVWVHVTPSFHVMARAPVPIRLIYCRLSPRWPVVRDGADLCALREGLVRNQDSKGDGLMRLAHIEALAGQFASLWLLNVPPRRLGGRLWPNAGRSTPAFSHTTLSRATFSHDSFTQRSLTQLFHTQPVRTHTRFFHAHNFLKSPILHHLLCLFFSMCSTASTPVCNYCTKLTCGATRSLKCMMFVMWRIVMWCVAAWCIVVWCIVMWPFIGAL